MNMINHFTINRKLCKLHNLPQAFICVDAQCKFQPLLCSDCIKASHPHLQSIQKMEDFIEHVMLVTRRESQSFERNKTIINVSAIIKSKKQEIEQKQLEILEFTMKKLAEEKIMVFEGLDLLQRAYSAKEALFRKNLQERSQILAYLRSYSETAQLLQLKLLCSSDWGIVNLKNNILELQNLGRQFANRNVDVSTEIILRQAERKMEGTFIHSLRNFVFGSLAKISSIPKPEQYTSRNRLNTNRTHERTCSGSTQRKNQSMELIPRISSSPSRKFKLSNIS